MKKYWAIMVILVLICGIGGCANLGSKPSADETDTIDNWDFFNERAEVFVTAMANGNFEAAVDMFDETMKQALSVSALQNDVWNPIIQQAGEFVAIYEIENLLMDGYYICFTTSQHETSGVKLRIVFSENGLMSGLFIDGYPAISNDFSQLDGIYDSPVVIGEGTEFPLNGLLSMPDDTTDLVPAVVLVHGSGPHDMDETIFVNKPFRDIAEYLAENGIAVIRYDKRTFTHGAKFVEKYGSSATVEEEIIEDAILAAEILKSDPRINENKVFMLGHSLGGMLAPRIHAEGGNFAGIISLAGSPRSLLDISYDQQMAYIEKMPEGAEKTDALSEMETYDEQIDTLMKLSDDEAKNTPMPGGISFYYYREMDAHPVSDYIKDIQIPFLIMQGEKDFQVYAGKDYVLWQEVLAGRTNATFKLYQGLNHLFMPSTGKNITEYQEEYKIASHVDSQILLDIVEWIKAN